MLYVACEVIEGGGFVERVQVHSVHTMGHKAREAADRKAGAGRDMRALPLHLDGAARPKRGDVLATQTIDGELVAIVGGERI